MARPQPVRYADSASADGGEGWGIDTLRRAQVPDIQCRTLKGAVL